MALITNPTLPQGNVSGFSAYDPSLGGTPLGGSPFGGPSVTPTPANVSSLFEAINAGVTNLANANAQNTIAAGDTQEAAAYGNAIQVAEAGARLSRVAGSVQQQQEGVQIAKTIGQQKAAVAGGGFAASGTALNLLRSSTRQGMFQQQITGVDAELKAEGFETQGAAATAEQASATAAAGAATATAKSLTAIGQQSKTNAINEAAAMGLNIPGLQNLSSTNIPNANPVTVAQQNNGSVGLGGNNGTWTALPLNNPASWSSPPATG